MKRNAVISLALALSLLAGCAAGAAENTSRPSETATVCVTEATPEPTSSAEVDTITTVCRAEAPTGGNSLALRLLELECAKKGGNVILSPLSIETALGMASVGAIGEAKEALEKLGLNGGQGAALSQTEGESPLSMANSMWFNEKLDGQVKQSFKDTLAAQYGAEEGFFTPKSDASVKEINSWVKEKTHEKIDSIVNRDVLSEDALAVLINALYFDGKWAAPFEDYQVRQGKFHAAGADEDAQLMSGVVKTYFEHGGFTGFSKAYEDGYEFIGILPEELGLDLTKLDIDAFLDSRTGAYDVDIEIPKFELEYSNSLKKTLAALDLGSLFEEHAMDGMLTDQAIARGDTAWVSDVLHKTYMKMYEEGTEAAAVTAVVITYGTTAVVKPRERRQVFLNRPFAFLIRDTETGRVVFCGAVNSME